MGHGGGVKVTSKNKRTLLAWAIVMPVIWALMTTYVESAQLGMLGVLLAHIGDWLIAPLCVAVGLYYLLDADRVGYNRQAGKRGPAPDQQPTPTATNAEPTPVPPTVQQQAASDIDAANQAATQEAISTGVTKVLGTWPGTAEVTHLTDQTTPSVDEDTQIGHEAKQRQDDEFTAAQEEIAKQQAQQRAQLRRVRAKG